MTPEGLDRQRYVVLGLAHVRATWFREVARWATGGAIPVEFVMCLSADELRIRLASGRVHSALLLDGGLPATDRSLIAAATARGCAVLVVDSADRPTDWTAVGAAAVLEPGFDRGLLVRTLRQHATPVRPTDGPERPTRRAPGRDEREGTLIAVTGPGGTGASTVAMALTQELARGAADDDVLLADLARRGDLALLDDVGDVVPGLPELVELHRRGDPPPSAVLELTFTVAAGHRLLLGLRRPRDWTAVAPESFRAALAGLRRIHRTVVVDVDADVEGERESGSIDVEERNELSRTSLTAADVAVVVGGPGPKGIASLDRVLQDLLEFGVAETRLVPIVNRGPRSRAARRDVARALAACSPGDRYRPDPVFLPERRDVDDRLRHGSGPPAALGAPVSRAVARALAAAGASSDTSTPGAVRVRPGTVGSLAVGAEP